MPRINPTNSTGNVKISATVQSSSVTARSTNNNQTVQANRDSSEYYADLARTYAEISKHYADLAAELTPTTIDVNNVTTGEPGTNASVTNVGTTRDALLDFVIPRGDTGNGISRIAKTSTVGVTDTYTIYYTDGTTTTYDIINAEPITYTHTQDVASDTWTINHSLGKHPSSVMVEDSSGNIIYPPISNVTDTSCTIEFIGATTGKAYLM